MDVLIKALGEACKPVKHGQFRGINACFTCGKKANGTCSGCCMAFCGAACSARMHDAGLVCLPPPMSTTMTTTAVDVPAQTINGKGDKLYRVVFSKDFKIDPYVRSVSILKNNIDGIRIYLFAFAKDSRYAKPGKPFGIVKDKERRSVYVFWNVGLATRQEIGRELAKLRYDIRKNIKNYMWKGRTGPYSPPPTEIFDAAIVSVFETQYKDPEFRRKLAQGEYGMFSVTFLAKAASQSRTFIQTMGAYVDTWYYMIRRIDSTTLRNTLLRLDRQSLVQQLKRVAQDAEAPKGRDAKVRNAYRDLFFEAYETVFLTTRSSVPEVLLAIMRDYLTSGVRKGPHARPDTYNRAADKSTHITTLDMVNVIQFRMYYFKELNAHPPPANNWFTWGIYEEERIEPDGTVTYDVNLNFERFESNIVGYIHQLVERKMVEEDRYTSLLTGKELVQWRLPDVPGAVGFIKMFPPDN